MTLFERIRRGLFMIWTREELIGSESPLTFMDDLAMLAIIAFLGMAAMANLLLGGQPWS